MNGDVKRLIKYKHLLLIILILCGFRFGPFLLGRTIYFGDNYSLLVPGKIFTASCIRSGVIPFWNLTLLAGIPWISDVSQSVLYPSTLLFMFLEPAVALNLTVILHLLISFAGMYFLSKRFDLSKYNSVIAGLMWIFSTQVTASMNNLATLQSIVWFPWIICVGMNLRLGRKYSYCFKGTRRRFRSF